VGIKAHCNPTQCNTLQGIATHCSRLPYNVHKEVKIQEEGGMYITQCNRTQHNVTKLNTMQQNSTQYALGGGYHTVTLHTATHCNALQHTATHCNAKSTQIPMRWISRYGVALVSRLDKIIGFFCRI